MDFIGILKAVVLGIIEGATEFLPISSSGHLIISADLLRYTGEQAKVFEIFIQLGSILAIVFYYRLRIGAVITGAHRDPVAQRLLLNLAIAFFPAALLGLVLHSVIKQYLFSPLTVAAALVIGGFAILLIERFKPVPRIQSVEDMRWSDALKVGLAQSLSLFPGVSRAGSTIMGGMVFGLSRQAATEFSFFLAIPTMFAATCYDLYKNIDILDRHDALIFATGFITAFITALFVVKMLLNYVAKHDFKWFGYYRIVFGSIVFAYFWFR